VDHIRPVAFSVPPFPGYEKVILGHTELQLIVRDVEPTWKTALSTIGGVYLILDRSTGKQYVGSASGAGGIWQRWGNYASDGHGGNRELRLLVGAEGVPRAGHFQYSILEVLSRSEMEAGVIARENHWKLALGTRQFGNNPN